MKKSKTTPKIISREKASGKSLPVNAGSSERERRHQTISSGGNLRAAVFGINDGLLSNASLLFGIAGANTGQHFMVLSGIAGLLAGACSMAAGEYISVRSQRELFDHQIALEKSALEDNPEEEAAELAQLYQTRGLPKQDALRFSKLIMKQPDKALDTLVREGLGINPAEISSPWGAAFSSFFAFCLGAFIPLLPFILGEHRWNLLFSIILTALALFIVGSTLSLFTNRSAIKSGLRMLLIGIFAGCLTFFIGKLLGITLH